MIKKILAIMVLIWMWPSISLAADVITNDWTLTPGAKLILGDNNARHPATEIQKSDQGQTVAAPNLHTAYHPSTKQKNWTAIHIHAKHVYVHHHATPHRTNRTNRVSTTHRIHKVRHYSHVRTSHTKIKPHRHAHKKKTLRSTTQVSGV